MKASRLITFAALGIAAGLLFNTKRGAKIRKDIADNSEDWLETINDFSKKTADELSGLSKIVSKEAKGLSADARKRILDIIDESKKSATNLKKKVAAEVS